VKSALRLVALDETAERLGLRAGQTLADARAMIPALAVADDDPAADRALLATVADWAERYTPLVALDTSQQQEARSGEAATGKQTIPARSGEAATGKQTIPARSGEAATGKRQHGLMLDITGSSHLFGGEEALLADLLARLAARGLHAAAAIADTPGAASAAARFGGPSIVPEGGATDVLRPLPLAALRLDHETVAALDRTGLKRIGQIVEAPRAPLAARFGAVLLRRLDQALGREEEAINPRRPVPAMIAERCLAEPITREEDIVAVLASLATTLSRQLEARGLGARRLELALFRVDGAMKRIAVGAGRPLNAPRPVLAIFREKFAGLGEAIDAGFGFDMVRLAAAAVDPVDPAQIDLAGNAVAASDLDGLIDRIGARLGSRHVARIRAHDSHIPERAAIFEEINEEDRRSDRNQTRGEEDEGDTISRPLRLFARPEPVEAIAEVPDGPPVRFRWRRALYQVVRAEGPERIAPEWWCDDDFTRDYFRVEDPAGRRFWLYREGLYGSERTAPRWYLHGVFG